MGCHLGNLGLIWKMHWSGRVVLSCFMTGHWHWNNVGVATDARGVSHHVSQRSFARIRKEDAELPSPCSSTAVLYHETARIAWTWSWASRNAGKDVLEGTGSRNFCFQPGRKDVKVSTKSWLQCLLCFSTVIHGRQNNAARKLLLTRVWLLTPKMLPDLQPGGDCSVSLWGCAS